MAYTRSRQMVPGKDTVTILAEAYGLKPAKARDIIREAGVKLVREDGFRGHVVMIASREPGEKRTRRLGWSDGQVGVDLGTTKITRKSIMAVSKWVFDHYDEHLATL